MRIPTSVVSGSTSRTLTNRRSSLTQKPVRNSCAITALVARNLSCCAARSVTGVKDERRFVNVREVLPDTTLVGIRIYEFDDDYRLISISSAERGEFAEKNLWR